jgi:hypothetical protein
MTQRVVVSCCLLCMALMKVVRPQLPAGALMYFVLPAAVIVEAVLAIGLLLAHWRWAAAGTAVLGFAGVAGVAVMKWSGVAVQSCGCFGAVQVSEGWHLAVCVAMVAAGLSLLHSGPPASRAQRRA